VARKFMWLIALAGLAITMIFGAGVLPAEAAPKYVFAHYMVCCSRDGHNATVDQLAQEIREAQAAGIDGFVLNCGGWANTPYYQSVSAQMFKAAEAVDRPFKLFFSADDCCGMTPEWAADMVATYADRPNYLHQDGKPVLSTFGGDGDWGRAVRQAIHNRGYDVFFVPFYYPADKSEAPGEGEIAQLVTQNSDIDGYFFFGAAGSSSDLARSIRFHAPAWHAQGKLFMAGIAPYYRGGGPNNRMFESKGFDRMQQQWLAAIQGGADWVELVTWNDWGESTYLAPVGSPADRDIWQGLANRTWGRLLSHDGFLDASKYYISWFKQGRPPAIEHERIDYFYRIHPQTLTPRPSTREPIVDRVFLTAFLSRPAAFTLTVGKTTTTINLPSGVSSVSSPLAPGSVEIAVRRAGKSIAKKTAEEPILESPDFGSYNYFAGTLALPRR
jgi:glucan endo-1,3-alpha-glucosidase